MPQFFGELENRLSSDSYLVDLVAGRTYYFEMEGAPTGQGSLLDPDLLLYRNGNFVAFGGDFGVGLNSRIVFTAPETGTYVLEAQSAGTSGGTYRLNAFEDDFRNSVEGSGALGSVRFGEPVSGNLDYDGDHDLFGTVLIAGLRYGISLSGSDSRTGTLPDPILRVLDGSGAVLLTDDDSGTGRDSYLDFRASTSGLHFIEAAAHGDSGTGTFFLSMSSGFGTNRADTIVGTRFDDPIEGADGSDRILGGQGNDRLSGGAGGDTLRGQAGDDTLVGGRHGDLLIGGTGRDTFVFDSTQDSSPGSRDHIAAGDNAIAFQGAGAAGGDRIDLRGIDADATTGTVDAFIFGGVGKGHISLVNSGSYTIVRGNVDDDSAFEFELVIEDGGVRAGAYCASDFLL